MKNLFFLVLLLISGKAFSSLIFTKDLIEVIPYINTAYHVKVIDTA